MTAPASVYPRSLDDLLPEARALVERLGRVPSENLLKAELNVGRPKAKALREALTRPEPARTAPEDTDTEPGAPADGRQPAPSMAADPYGPNPVSPLNVPGSAPSTAPVAPTPAVAAEPLVAVDVDPGTEITGRSGRSASVWPVWLIALPAFVAIWSGWVGLGGLTGFGIVHPLPGIADGFAINTAITLPIGVEVYAAYALRVWFSGDVPDRARRFARWSAIGSLLVGALGQIAYHVLVAAGITAAPWWITTLVACLPVAVLGMAGALAHLIRHAD